MMDRDTMGSLIAEALQAASRRAPPDGYPATPINISATSPEPGGGIETSYELEPGQMAPWMARVIGDGVAAGVVDHLRKNMAVTSSVAVDGLSSAFGSEVSTGADTDVDLEFRPLLVITYTTVTVTTCFVFKDMGFTLKVKSSGNTYGADRVTLSAKKFTINTDADVNPAGGGSTVYWLAIGDRRTLNARGASTKVQ